MSPVRGKRAPIVDNALRQLREDFDLKCAQGTYKHADARTPTGSNSNMFAFTMHVFVDLAITKDTSQFSHSLHNQTTNPEITKSLTPKHLRIHI